ncbi:MAG: circularly permuted type 2 ATP-grasp protein, partial [Emticicia sp.]|nr:circularly permuted type 2 ATP-grasp protein [Emticicia sp.]
MNYDFSNYKTEKFFDEMITPEGDSRTGNQFLKSKIENLAFENLKNKQNAAERSMVSAGITFNVYSEDGGTERIIPIDVVPRVIDSQEWDNLEKGLVQRITALNMFLQDIYNEQKIIHDGIVPREIIESSKGFLPECMGITPPKGVWIHITGTDLIRDNNGVFTVLEDNLRCPSGVSYMLENRELSKQTFPDVLSQTNVRSISEYPA